MTAGGSPLSQRVAERLRDGPVHTLAIARDILGLSGHTGAASAAVFALLGNDPRFRVSPAGEWTFEDTTGTRLLSDLRFAVVDVETTGGGVHKGHRVTEFAVVEVHGLQIVDDWSTLINPGRDIPSMIQRITGITPEMVRSAPLFEHVAPEVAERIDGRVFVAHNAQFDRSFVRAELVNALGESPPFTSLCTVRLARFILPKLRRRNLDELTQYLGIRIENRHRALGDAMATAQALIHMLNEAHAQGIVDLDTLERLMSRGGRRKKKQKQPEATPETDTDE